MRRAAVGERDSGAMVRRATAVADMCRGGEMARGAAELPGEGVMAKRANDERMRRQDGYEL